jgi:hypothetical protein
LLAMVRAISPILAALVILVCRCMVADQARTNAIPPSDNQSQGARVWISSFEPLIVTNDHQLDLPRPCSPIIAESCGRYWQTNYDAFSRILVAAAEGAHLDSDSLAKMLRAIWDEERGALAILPVEADSTSFQSEPVFRGGVLERDIDHRKIKFQAQSWLAAHSINKNLLQLIRRQPLVRVGLVHDRNASEVSDSSTDERTGTTAPTSKATFAVSPASKFN